MHFLPLLFRNCSSVWKRLKETEAKHYLWRYYHSSLTHFTAEMRRDANAILFTVLISRACLVRVLGVHAR